MTENSSLTPEDFRNIAQDIQAILFLIAAILGALWAHKKLSEMRVFLL